MSQSKRHKPRTGTGDKARGKKPSETGILQMQAKHSPNASFRPTDSQPKGWGIAKVVGLFSKKGKS